MPSFDATQDVLAAARKLSPHEFRTSYATPFLMGDALRLDGATPHDASTTAIHTRDTQIGLKDPMDSFPSTRIFPLEKTQRNPFLTMITIGRAANNDVWLDIATVSKFHAYFRKDASAAEWRLVDARSQNGTWVRGERLAPGSDVVVRDGDALSFGGSGAAFRFFDTLTMYHLIRGFVLEKPRV